MSKICLRFVVSGKVQGVYFRDSTRKLASSLNLTGWVENLEDGRVEGVACGEAAAISQLCEWLNQGPPRARVDDVQKTEIPYQEFSEFEVR